MERITMKAGLVYAALGAGLWLTFAVFLRLMIAAEMTSGPGLLLIYVLAAPAGLIVVWVYRQAGAQRGQMFEAISIGTIVALMLDGLAVGWVPAVYSTDTARLSEVAGVILWGAGLGMLIALWVDRRG